MPYLRKVIVLILSISFCLTNFSLAIGATYAVDNPGWHYVDYDFTLPNTLLPSDAKITNIKIEYSYSHCPYDYVTIKLSKKNGDTTPIYLVKDGVAQYVNQTPLTWNSPANYFANSKANDVWTLRMDIIGNTCQSDPNCKPSYSSGHTAYFSPGTMTISYEHTPPPISSPANRFFTGLPINFQWLPLPNADSYKVNILDDNSNFFKEETIATTTFNTSSDSTLNLQSMHKYYWNVAANNAVGIGVSSEARRFIIGQAECWPDVGIGVGAINGYDHFDTCYVLNSNPEKYLMKDISRRGNMNVDGHNGHMSSTASIVTQLNNASGPMENPVIFWQGSGQESAVDAHVNAAKVYDYLNLRFYTGPASPIAVLLQDSMINSMENPSCDNAEFQTSEPKPTVNYCAGTAYSSSLGIVGHEWTHAVTARAAGHGDDGLGASGEGGALDESFSDWMGTAIKFANNESNWIITIGDTTRNLADPLQSRDSDGKPQPIWYGGANWLYCSPTTVPDADNDMCGVHQNNGVPNLMFYRLSQAIGIEKAIKIAYQANNYHWEGDLPGRPFTFVKARDGMIKAAEDIFGIISTEATQVDRAWTAVGVTPTSTPESLNVKRIMPTILNIVLDL